MIDEGLPGLVFLLFGKADSGQGDAGELGQGGERGHRRRGSSALPKERDCAHEDCDECEYAQGRHDARSEISLSHVSLGALAASVLFATLARLLSSCL